MGSKLSHYVRRCHVCGAVTEREKRNKDNIKCSHCGKAIAPFLYFADEQVPMYSDNECRPGLASEGRMPVRGLSAMW